jgi:hypothetical protein
MNTKILKFKRILLKGLSKTKILENLNKFGLFMEN